MSRPPRRSAVGPVVALSSATLGTSASDSASGRPNILESEYSRESAAALYDVVRGGEPVIDACLRALEEWVLMGDIEVRFGGSDIVPFAISALADTPALRDLFREAMIWKALYGMCPVAFSHDRTAYSIPMLGTGVFRLEYNTRTFVKRVFYHIESHPNAGAGDRKTKKLPVFVWPGYIPEGQAAPRFTSTAAQLLKPFVRISSLRRNMLAADEASARPTLFASRPSKDTDIMTATEQVLYSDMGGQLEGGDDLDAEQMVKRSMFMRGMFEANAALLNAATAGTGVVADAKGQKLETVRTSSFPGTLHRLEEGESLQRQPIATSRTDILKHEADFNSAVAMVTHVPLGLVQADLTTSVKSDNRKQIELARDTIKRERTALSVFYSWIHTTMYHNRDSQFLLEHLTAADLVADHLQTRGTSSPLELARINDIRKNIHVVAAMPDRVHVYFFTNPFPPPFELALLRDAAAAGAISNEEQVSLFRESLYLPPITSDSRLLEDIDPAAPPTIDYRTGRTGVGTASELATGIARESAAAISADLDDDDDEGVSDADSGDDGKKEIDDDDDDADDDPNKSVATTTDSDSDDDDDDTPAKRKQAASSSDKDTSQGRKPVRKSPRTKKPRVA